MGRNYYTLLAQPYWSVITVDIRRIFRPAENSFEELELMPYLESLGSLSHSEGISMITCKNCGANQHIEENYKSLHCVYCSSPLIIEDMRTEEWILQGAVLPFQIDQKKAHIIFPRLG